jgi:hypothetical protein
VPPPKLPPEREPRPRRRDYAAAWLREYMAARGPVISSQVIADGTAAGFSHTALYQARVALHVKLERVTGVPGAPHMWS